MVGMDVPMSLRLLIVEIDTKSLNVTRFCAGHGISTWFFYDLRRRYASGGLDALEPRSGTVRTVRFFAVGTNMDEEWMRGWIPAARRLTIASLSGFSVRWHKRSSDGGKLAALRTGQPDDVIWGVVYEVDGLNWQQIDEGQRAHGYRDEHVTVVGRTATSTTPRCTSPARR